MSIFFLYKTLSASAQEEHLCACCSTTINLNTIQAFKTEKPPVKQTIEKPTVKQIEKQPIKKTIEKVEKKEPFIEKEIKPLIQNVQEVEKVVQLDQNLTQSVQNLQQKKDVDTQCKTEVIVTKEVEQKKDNYLALHVGEIVALLKENLYYPRRARQQGIEGVVKVKFTLSKEAKISNIEVLESKHEILSRAAVETIENLEEKLPKPDEELTLTIPINYDLQ